MNQFFRTVVLPTSALRIAGCLNDSKSIVGKPAWLVSTLFNIHILVQRPAITLLRCDDLLGFFSAAR